MVVLWFELRKKCEKTAKTSLFFDNLRGDKTTVFQKSILEVKTVLKFSIQKKKNFLLIWLK